MEFAIVRGPAQDSSADLVSIGYQIKPSGDGPPRDLVAIEVHWPRNRGRESLLYTSADLVDERHTTQQPTVNRVAKRVLLWLVSPTLNVATVRILRIAAAHVSLPGGVYIDNPEFFCEITVSNATVAIILAVVAMLLSRIWKNAAALHILAVVVTGLTETAGYKTWSLSAVVAVIWISGPALGCGLPRSHSPMCTRHVRL